MNYATSLMLRTVTPLTVLIGVWLGVAPLAAMAQYIPPDRGLPGRREGGGTRGNCVSSDRPLIALMPETNFGVTVVDEPTLYWFVPAINAAFAEFVLLDDSGNEILTKQLPVSETSGIVGVKLVDEANQAVIEAGQDYHWFFSLVCNPLDRSGDIFSEGWLRRMPSDPALTSQLEGAPVGDRPTIYANAGIWHDALDALATLRCGQPNDVGLKARWADLLKSVGLETLSDASIETACNTGDL